MTNRIGDGKGFDWLMAVLGGWFTAGVFVDGWAHLHLDLSGETFFTPWHAIMYGGFFACALALVIAWTLNMRTGHSWKTALPRHYLVALVGVGIFALAGLGDLIWHTVFGIEQDLEALLSPTHLMLAFGGALITGAQFRALLARVGQARRGLIADLPAILSLTYFLSIFAFMGQYLHPLGDIWAGQATANPYFGQALGLAQVIFFTILLMALTLPLIRRNDMPAGSFMVILGLHAISMSVLHDAYIFIVPTFIAGFCIDLLLAFAGGKISRIFELRLFGFFAPVIFFSFYFLTVALTTGIAWSVHMWVGAMVIAGLLGWLFTYLAAPAYHERSM